LNKELRITSKCPKEDGDACKYSWSRISAIEVIPYAKPLTHSKDEANDSTVNLGCGEAR